MKKPSFGNMKDVQQKIAQIVSTEDTLKIEDIRYIAGFDVAYVGNKCVCAAVVLDFKTMKVIERKHIVDKPSMNYVPGFMAFREGPLIIQAYYSLEHEPEILMVEGHGIAHPLRAGVATFVGTELVKPTIGVAKNLLEGEVKDDKIIIEDEVVGVLMKTKEYARPVYISPGHMISVEMSAEISKMCIVPPHKLPEPIHKAHRYANKMLKEENPKKLVEAVQ